MLNIQDPVLETVKDVVFSEATGNRPGNQPADC